MIRRAEGRAMMRAAIVVALVMTAGAAAGQGMIEPAPASLACRQEWRRFHSEAGRLVMRMRCNDGQYVAAMFQGRDRKQFWDGVVTCAARQCGQDKISLYSEVEIADGAVIGCEEFGKMIPREWSCKATQ